MVRVPTAHSAIWPTAYATRYGPSHASLRSSIWALLMQCVPVDMSHVTPHVGTYMGHYVALHIPIRTCRVFNFVKPPLKCALTCTRRSLIED